MADEMLGEWAGVVPVLMGGERVLVWAVETMRFCR
jgi:hypothetical protein